MTHPNHNKNHIEHTHNQPYRRNEAFIDEVIKTLQPPIPEDRQIQACVLGKQLYFQRRYYKPVVEYQRC